MKTINLEAKTRKELGKKAKALRTKGLIPAIIYGFKVKNQPLSVERHAFKDAYGAAGSSSLVDLKIDDSSAHKVLITKTQSDPVSGEPIHIDFYQVRMDQKIKTEVPLVFVGESKAVKEQEGNLITNKDSVEIECLPNDLIPEIKVDISPLQTFEDTIHVKNLTVPPAVTILNDPEETVALVEEPRSEEELAELSEEVAEDVEGVEVEEKKEEGEEEAEGGAPAEGEKLAASNEGPAAKGTPPAHGSAPAQPEKPAPAPGK